MRVFVGYGYNARDQWIEKYVIPMVRAFGCTVHHGKAVYGGTLPAEILKLIRASDAMIGFTTRREAAVMSLSIQQDQTYLGHDRWKWSIWLAGTPTELDQVDRVVYILHPTFHNPVREVDDRATSFRLDASGWGAFTIRAKAVLRDGKERALRHDLELHYPDGTPTPA